MKTTHILVILLLLFTASPAWAQDTYAPGEILVKFRPSGERAAMAGVSAQEGVSVESKSAVKGVYKLKIPKSASVEEMVRLYQEHPDVEWAEPNFRVHMAMIPDDADYASEQKWYYDLLWAERAWDHEQGDPSVILAILDSGVDLDHPDLVGKMWMNEDEIPADGLDNDGNIQIDDLYGWDFVDGDNDPDVAPRSSLNGGVSHGTMVAGIAAATSNNGVGVTGMAWGCTIMPVRVLDPRGSGWTDDIADGIMYAAMSGARVINLSLGGPSADMMGEAVQQAHDTYGCVIVAAAGNDHVSTLLYPARFSRVIGVGASDHSDPDGRAYFSNWGSGLDVVAPGEDIWSTSVDNATGVATYRAGDGTSFSSPLVAGLCGLILSRYPHYTNEQVRDLLKATATDLPDDPNDVPNAGSNWDGAGMVNAYQALRLLGDVTRNDIISAYDASLILRHTVRELTLAGGDSVAGDVSGTAGLSSYDASLVLKRVVDPGLVFPAEVGAAPRLVVSEERTIRVGAMEHTADGRLQAAIFANTRDGIVAGEMDVRLNENAVRVTSVLPGTLPPEYLWASHTSGDRIHLAFAGAEPLSGEGPLAWIVLDPLPSARDAALLRIERVRLNEGQIPARPADLSEMDREIVHTPIPQGTKPSLHPNRPNPFNASTQIEYEISTPGHIRLTVYDVLGRKLETLVDAWRPVGRHTIRWDAGDTSSGVYFCHLNVNGERAQVRRMLLVR